MLIKSGVEKLADGDLNSPEEVVQRVFNMQHSHAADFATG